MNQHLVEDELEEDWRRQRQQLHKQRCDKDMGDRTPVAHKRRPEPMEAESVGIDARAAKSPRDQHDFAGGQCLGVLKGHLLGDAGDWIEMFYHPLCRADAKDCEAALLQAEYRGIGNCAEALGGHAAKDSRFQKQEVRAPNDIFRLGGRAGQSQLMAQLCGIGRDPIIAREQRQCG